MCGQLFHGSMEVLSTYPRFLKEVTPKRSERYARSAAFEENNAEPAFQQLHPTGKCRLVDAQRLRCASERTVVRSKAGVSQVSQVERKIWHSMQPTSLYARFGAAGPTRMPLLREREGVARNRLPSVESVSPIFNLRVTLKGIAIAAYQYQIERRGVQDAILVLAVRSGKAAPTAGFAIRLNHAVLP